MLKIFTDGGARGNPGKSAIGVYVTKDDREIFQKSLYIGHATNNIAEYKALITALEWLESQKIADQEVIIHLDSKLVVEQVNGNFRVKDAKLIPLFNQVKKILGSLSLSPTIIYIERAKNFVADSLVNKALDEVVSLPSS